MWEMFLQKGSCIVGIGIVQFKPGCRWIGKVIKLPIGPIEGEECVYYREAGDEAEPPPPSRGGDREREGLDSCKLPMGS